MLYCNFLPLDFVHCSCTACPVDLAEELLAKVLHLGEKMCEPPWITIFLIALGCAWFELAAHLFFVNQLVHCVNGLGSPLYEPASHPSCVNKLCISIV